MRKIVAGNWKMNKSYADAMSLMKDLDQFCDQSITSEVLIFPPMIYLQHLSEITKNKNVQFGAQNAAEHDWGAFTGEVSFAMLQSIGIKLALIGHSERRTLFHEDNESIAQKVKSAHKHGICFILCVGETLQEREEGSFSIIIEEQLKTALRDLIDLKELYIAYEPVWAIGTGKTATSQEIEQAHLYIKSLTSKLTNIDPVNINVLYGGSCTEKNALEILSTPGVDGVLVGGASLQLDSFKTIIQAAETCIQK